jgi:hypothetical protein
VISHLTAEFRECFQRLPKRIQATARKNYALWKQDPAHSSLEFKRVHARRPIYSVRVGIGWRALGIREGETVVWFWIGSHSVYDKLIDQL